MNEGDWQNACCRTIFSYLATNLYLQSHLFWECQSAHKPLLFPFLCLWGLVRRLLPSWIVKINISICKKADLCPALFFCEQIISWFKALITTSLYSWMLSWIPLCSWTINNLTQCVNLSYFCPKSQDHPYAWFLHNWNICGIALEYYLYWRFNWSKKAEKNTRASFLCAALATNIAPGSV